MADEATKLLSTRSERYPEPNGADAALGVSRAALAAIPIVGGSITEVVSMALAPSIARRRDEWLGGHTAPMHCGNLYRSLPDPVRPFHRPLRLDRRSPSHPDARTRQRA